MARQYAEKGPKTAVRTAHLKKQVSEARNVKLTSERALKSKCAYSRCQKFFERNPHQKHHNYCSGNCRKRAWEEKKIIETAIRALNLYQEKLKKA